MRLDERVSQFDHFLEGMVSDEFRVYLINNGFFEAPASTKFHGSYEGGLFDHSFAVAKFLVSLTKRNELTWQRPESPYFIGMFHDLCKIDQYRHPIVAEVGCLDGKDYVYDTNSWEYNPDTLLTGHGDKSVMLLSAHMRLTEEEMLCIRFHMGAFTSKEEWSSYTGAIHKYPNVLWTHQADMLASHVAGI